MQGGPVLPAIEELHRHLVPGPQFRPLYTTAIQQGPPGSNGLSSTQMPKRAAPQSLLAGGSPAKKQTKWTPKDDNLAIELRGQGMKWDDVAKRLPGRSSTSCRLRYQNYIEKRTVWDEEKKNKLARLYARFKGQMWQKVAIEMGIPWRSAESMHWQLGEQELSARANAPVIQLHSWVIPLGSPPTVPLTPAPMSGQGPPSHGFTATNVPHLGPTLPQIQPQSKEDLTSGALTAPVPDTQPDIKGVGWEGTVGRPVWQGEARGRWWQGADVERRSQEGRSPDRSSQLSEAETDESLDILEAA